MWKTDSVMKIDDWGRRYQIKNIVFEIDKWNFNNDGGYGHIHFTVPKGSYKYESNNGAYCYNKDEETDGIHVATPCCFQNHNAIIIDFQLSEILKEAIVFADYNLTRCSK